MMLSLAEKYHAYARECLRIAEKANQPKAQESLVKLSHVWLEAAIKEERDALKERAFGAGAR
jgi:hypothetical protein